LGCKKVPKEKMRSAKFITLEGIDGAGKSTHINFIKQYLTQNKIDFVVTREPGGTELGEKLRELLLHDPMHAGTETLLMFAARFEHLQKIIMPSLNEGITVLCDRFSDATLAYQSAGKGVSEEFIKMLQKYTHVSVNPDLTLLFDLPTEVSLERLKKTRVLDKFEKEAQQFHDNVRQSYLSLAKLEPSRFHVIDSTQSIDTIQSILKNVLDKTIK
jgi:dTMP kinase